MYSKQLILAQNVEELSHTKRRISRTLADRSASAEYIAQAIDALAWVVGREKHLERLHLKQCGDVSFQVRNDGDTGGAR